MRDMKQEKFLHTLTYAPEPICLFSLQGIININKGSNFFSFRKRSKFAKMAEHFEYNHIPAQLSSIHHFRVKSVLCFR